MRDEGREIHDFVQMNSRSLRVPYPSSLVPASPPCPQKSLDQLGRSRFRCRTCVTMPAEVLRMIPTNDSPEPDDRQLVEQIRHGDEGAFEMLVRRKTSKV